MLFLKHNLYNLLIFYYMNDKWGDYIDILNCVIELYEYIYITVIVKHTQNVFDYLSASAKYQNNWV